MDGDVGGTINFTPPIIEVKQPSTTLLVTKYNMPAFSQNVHPKGPKAQFYFNIVFTGNQDLPRF